MPLLQGTPAPRLVACLIISRSPLRTWNRARGPPARTMSPSAPSALPCVAPSACRVRASSSGCTLTEASMPAGVRNPAGGEGAG